jgi:DNA-binding MarR family transcriptional regulator
MQDGFSDRLPLGFLLNTVGRLVAEQTAQALRSLDLDPPQLGILWLVAEWPGQTQRCYARFQRRDASTFGRYVDELERKGLLRRIKSSTDRRALALELTDAGTRALQAGAPLSFGVERGFTEVLTTEQVRDLKASLRSILEHAGSL